MRGKHMKKIYIVCDFRENFPSKTPDGKILFNDHPRKGSVEEIKNSYCKLGYNCEIFGGVPELLRAIDSKQHFENCLFINMSDGLTQTYSRVQIPILCEILGVDYSGSDPFVVALMTNKHYSKLAVKEAGFLVPEGTTVSKRNLNSVISGLDKISFPVMLKPNTEGSSVGITLKNVCFSKDEVLPLLCKLIEEFNEVEMEAYIPGYEITNFLIGNPGDIVLNEVLGVKHHEKILFDREVITLMDNANKSTSYYMADEFFEKKVIEKIKSTTEEIAKTIGVKDILRIDYRLTEEQELYFLEINSVPRVSSTSEIGFICQERNISYENILKQYVDAIERRIYK